MENLPSQRQQWNDTQHQHHLEQPGVVFDPERGTFMQPEQLSPDITDTMTLRALHNVVTASRTPEGVTVGEARDLHQSSHWNVMVAGKYGETSGSVNNDRPVTDYFARRTAAVEAAVPVIEQRYVELQNALKEGIRDGIRQGYIPAYVEDRLDSLNKTAVQVVDSETIQNGKEYATAAQYTGDDEIKIAHDSLEKENMATVVVHESVHKLSGASFREHEDGHLERTRSGAATHTSLHVGLNEAVTQHVTVGALSGDFETVDPDIRNDGDKKYYVFRKVLTSVVDRSNNIVDVKAFTRAHFEDTDELSPSLAERRNLVSKMRTAYGSGALRKLDSIFNAAEAIDRQDPSAQRRLDSLMERIVSPQLDANGNYVPGAIDINGL